MSKTVTQTNPEDQDDLQEDEVPFDELEGVVGGLDHQWWPDRPPGDSPPDLY